MVLKDTLNHHVMYSISLEISLRTAPGLFEFTRNHSGFLTATNVIEFHTCCEKLSEIPEVVDEYYDLMECFSFEVLSHKVIAHA
jgi:hypothetical protein